MLSRWSVLRFSAVLCALLAGVAVEATSAYAASAPVIEDVWASAVNVSSARINGQVNPSGADTTYRFEYGPDTSYGSSVPVPDGDLGAGSEGIHVSQLLTGLQAGSTYHYRIVAVNSSGTTDGEDRSFTTFPVSPPQAADTCPNAAYRVGFSAGLPDCRAYEMVSPVDKNGSDISGEAVAETLASESGERVAFFSRTGFGDTRGAGVQGYSQYVAERQPGGWVTRGVTPTPDPAVGAQIMAYPTLVTGFSSDLSVATVHAYDLPEGPSTVRPNIQNLYLENTTTGKLFAAITDASNEGEPFPSYLPSIYLAFFGIPELGGATPSLGVVTFASHLNYVPEAKNVFNFKAYVYEHGAVKLLGVLPDGSIPPEGSTLVEPSDGGYRNAAAIEAKDTVSTDGSRILFAVNEFPGQIFMRKNGTESVMITESETGEPVTAEAVELLGATPDLAHIVFRADTRLVDSAPEGGGLYTYTDGLDPRTERNLTYIGPLYGKDKTDGDVVLGISHDGTRVYYRNGNSEVNLWESGRTRHLGGFFRYAHSMGVTPDGEELVFAGTPAGTSDGFAGPLGVYVYKAATNTLKCVSCPPTGAAPTLGVEFEVHANNAGTRIAEAYRPRFMTGDGRYVFFNTAEALVPQDTNGVIDAYEYDTVTDRLSLLSTGTGQDGAWFVDASANGENAFLVTRQKLTRWDPDKLVDVYDVRVNGGLAEPPAPGVPCAGDACQGTPAAAPSFNTASGFTGLGNPSIATALKVKARAKPNGTLRRALAVCRKKPKRKRAACRRLAHKRYGAGRSSARNRRAGR